MNTAWRKSSYSGANNECVEVWRKSSYTSANNECVEVAGSLDRVRDSKNPEPILRVDLGALFAAVKTGEIAG
ncbi:MAG TPA: DUF397 domain-containing protein [Pseudonocardiaceae bacterium]|jgi:hypothetical protein|nr:DUF397 domain-containing protein [Pseudonocardiaceae bacterium]